MKNYIYITILIFSVLSCSKKSSQLEEQNIVEEVKQNEQDSVYFESKSDSEISVTGIIEAPPQNLISISTYMGGIVKSMNLLEGMKVKKGDVLIKLQHKDVILVQQNYLLKKNELVYLENEYNRQKSLNEEKINATKIFQKTEADYYNLKIELKSLEEQLKLIGINTSNLKESTMSSTISISAPTNGYISKINVNIGKYVNPSEVLLEMVNNEHLHLELTIFENDISKLKIGQKIKFYLPNTNETEFYAKVHLIGKTIDENRAVRVHGHLEKESEELIPGMFVNAIVEI